MRLFCHVPHTGMRNSRIADPMRAVPCHAGLCRRKIIEVRGRGGVSACAKRFRGNLAGDRRTRQHNVIIFTRTGPICPKKQTQPLPVRVLHWNVTNTEHIMLYVLLKHVCHGMRESTQHRTHKFTVKTAKKNVRFWQNNSLNGMGLAISCAPSVPGV